MSRVNRHAVKLAGVVALLATGWLVWKVPAVRNLATPQHLVTLRDQVGSVWWGPVIFVASYALLAALNFSGLLLTVAGGAMFGFGWGVVLNTIGANLGASAAYGLARVLGKDAIAALLGHRFARVQSVTRAGGFLWLLRLRLIPVVPFNLLNIGAGLAGIPWRTFAAATVVGIFPATVVYTLFADAIVAGSVSASREAFAKLLIAGGLLVVLTFVPTAVRRRGRASVER